MDIGLLDDYDKKFGALIDPPIHIPPRTPEEYARLLMLFKKNEENSFKKSFLYLPPDATPDKKLFYEVMREILKDKLRPHIRRKMSGQLVFNDLIPVKCKNGCLYTEDIWHFVEKKHIEELSEEIEEEEKRKEEYFAKQNFLVRLFYKLGLIDFVKS